MSKRYARRGGSVPVIYPGTLKGLTTATTDAQNESHQGKQAVWLHDPPAETRLLFTFERGVKRYPPAKEELDEGS